MLNRETRPKKRWFSWAEKTPQLPKETGTVQSRLSDLHKSQHLQFCEDEVCSAVEAKVLTWMSGKFTAQGHLQKKILGAKTQPVLCSLSCLPLYRAMSAQKNRYLS